MKVYKSLKQLSIQNPVVTIGMFDGVHIAHQAILKRLLEVAKKCGGESVLITLWPHPRYVLNKDADKLKLLTTLEEKIEILEQTGVDHLIILPFDKDFAGISFDSFIREMLIPNLGICHLVVGFNHQFGKNREGSYDKLLALSAELGFTVEQLEPVKLDDEKVSSSEVRKILFSGNMEQVNRMLGYRFCVSGKVVEGKQVGRQLGFPTANIETDSDYKILPRKGVYAATVSFEGKCYAGMLNIGIRPTIDSNKKTVLEVHIFNFNEDIYNKKIALHFHSRLRDEKKFNSIDELRAQLEEDKTKVQEMITKAECDKQFK